MPIMAKVAVQWVEVAQVRGRLAADAVDSGLVNALHMRPSEYRVYAIDNRDTTFTYRVEVLARVARQRREAAANFARGVEYAAHVWS